MLKVSTQELCHVAPPTTLKAHVGVFDPVLATKKARLLWEKFPRPRNSVQKMQSSHLK